MLVHQLLHNAEALGLLALMLKHDSRLETRLNAAGEPVLLDEQDRSRLDWEKINAGIVILEEALALREPGPYPVQAAISAQHAKALTAEATDWRQIAALYGTLAEMTPSMVVEVNRAVARRNAQFLRCFPHLKRSLCTPVQSLTIVNRT